MVSRSWQVKKRRGSEDRVEILNRLLLRSNLRYWDEILASPLRLLYLNFLAGLARGFGIALGLTLLTALFLAIMARIASLNLPLIRSEERRVGKECRSRW